MNDPVSHTACLARSFLDETISARAFSDAVENFWNFGEWKKPYSDADKVALKKLFDVVVWYSEFESDTYPKYKSEADVRSAASEFISYSDDRRQI